MTTGLLSAVLVLSLTIGLSLAVDHVTADELPSPEQRVLNRREYERTFAEE